jgi:transcriptional regulator with XRE-family HTH domain
MTLMKQKRQELKMTQIDVAIACGVSLAGYLVWERGGGKPAKEKQALVIQVLGLPANYFEEK